MYEGIEAATRRQPATFSPRDLDAVADRVRGRDLPFRLRRRAEFQSYDHGGEPGRPRVLFHPCFSNGRISNGYTNAFSYRPVGPAFMVRIANAFTYSKSHSSPAADRKQRRGEARRLGTTPPGLRPQNLRIAGFGRIDSHRG